MKQRILLSLLLSTLLLASVTIAAVSITVSPNTLSVFVQEDQSNNLTINNPQSTNETVIISFSNPSAVDDGTITLDFNMPSSFTLGAGNSTNVPVSVIGNPQDLEFGIYTSFFDVNAMGSETNETDSKEVELKVVSSFCSAGHVGGNLSIDNVDINNEGKGDDDEWELLDTIEVEVEIENEGDEDIDDVMVELGLFDSSGDNVADDLDFLGSDDEEIDLGDIRDGDSEEIVFRFRVPADFDSGNYRLAVKAYSDDLGESNECVDFSSDLSDEFYDSISVDRVSDDDEAIIVEDIMITPEATCGEIVSGSFTVFNIGDRDEERIRIDMFNQELGLNQQFEITNDFDEGDERRFDFSFAIPDDAEDKLYPIQFRTHSDYRNGIYRVQSNDLFTGFTRAIGCQPPEPIGSNILITASLISEAKAGEDLTVNAIITNTGSEQKNTIVTATTYESWADSVSINPQVLTLASGQSATSVLTFKVKRDASGTQSFLIETTTNGFTDVQEVELTLQERGGLNLFSGDNTLVWVIGIVNLVLIILIILVAVRLSRR